MEPPKSASEDPAASAQPDLYALLGLSPEADAATVRQAWRRLAALYHPDAPLSASSLLDQNSRTEEFLRIQYAHSVLSHPDRRRQYDEERCACGNAVDRHSAADDLSISGSVWAATIARGNDAARRWLGALPIAAMFRVRYLATAVGVGILLLLLEMVGGGNPDEPWGNRLGITAVGKGFFSAASEAEFQSAERVAQLPEGKPLLDKLTPQRASREAGSKEEPLIARKRDPVCSSADASLVEPCTSPKEPGGDAESTFASASDRQEQEAGYSVGEVPRIPGHALTAWPPRVPVETKPAFSEDTWQQTWQQTWHGVWLAGCTIPQTGAIWTGTFNLRGREARLQWQAWNEESANAEASITLTVSPELVGSVGASPEARLLLSHPSDSTALQGFLTQDDVAFGRLHLAGAAARQVPCRQWRLAALQRGALAGQWILPDRRASADELFPLEYLEIVIDDTPDGVTGRLSSRYALATSHPASAGLAGAGFRPEVDFRFGSSAGGFDGVFHWRNGYQGEGTLRLAPLSQRSMAIRWDANRLVPGRVQLTRGTAMVWRR